MKTKHLIKNMVHLGYSNEEIAGQLCQHVVGKNEDGTDNTKLNLDGFLKAYGRFVETLRKKASR